MFKSINKSSGRPVVILDPQWDSQIDVLRTLANQNVLVCQECNQPVRVRAGGELTAGREGKKFIVAILHIRISWIALTVQNLIKF
jgi:hypothetical protein